MNLYERLEVVVGASDAEIKQAWRRMAMKYHPDRNPGDKLAEDNFKRVQEAYVILSDADKRASYDATLPKQKKPQKPTKNVKWDSPLQYADAAPPTTDIWGNPLSPQERAEWMKNLKTPMPEIVKKAHRAAVAPGFLDVFQYEDESSPDLR